MILESTGRVSEGVGFHVFEREQVVDHPVGAVFRRVFVARQLRQIFDHRERVLPAALRDRSDRPVK